MKVGSSQFNYRYGSQLHFPYSIAILTNYVNQHIDGLHFEKTFIHRDKLDDYVNQGKDLDVLLCSCYVWNWEITNLLAKRIKDINPKCIIIFGGPQVPDDCQTFFNNYPHVDILVHNEGEEILLNIFKNIENYEGLKGISTPKNPTWVPSDRINDINVISSPYLNDWVWKLVNKEDADWIVSWETMRGCPFACTFCDWGSATYAKVRNFELNRLKDEVAWFSRNKIVYIDCCDSNFGMFPKDLELARTLKENSKEFGFPITFRQSWTKQSSNKVIPIAKELKEGGLLMAVGLAVQSMDKETLKAIKRANIKFDSFAALTKEFEDNQIPTYTELIRGLPGETLESFKSGLNTMIEDSRIGALYIYNCGILPNAEMNKEEYKQKYGIKTVKSPIYLAHSSVNSRGVNEYEDFIIETNTASMEDIKEMYLYSWAVLCLHNFGLTNYIVEYLKREGKIKTYMEFYEQLLSYAKNSNGVLNEEYRIVKNYIDTGFSGGGWNHFDKNLGDIYWPIEEASWLRLSQGFSLPLELIDFLFNTYSSNSDRCSCMNNLVAFQFNSLACCKDSINGYIKYSMFYNWREYFGGKENLVKKDRFYYTWEPKVKGIGDVYDWCKQTIWYGRRTQKFRAKLGDLSLTLPNSVV